MAKEVPVVNVVKVSARPLEKRYAKTAIRHGFNPHKNDEGNYVCDTMVIEAGAELPADFDPVANGLEQGTHWELGR